MKLCYPFKESHAEELIVSNEIGRGGFYPLGINGFWHSGVHLTNVNSVRAICDGVVVAYRINETYLEDGARVLGNETDKRFSNGFVLLHHKLEIVPGSRKYIRFFSLYMHLLPWGFYTSKMKENRPSFFNGTRYYAAGEMYVFDESCKNPDAKHLPVAGKLSYGQEVFFADVKNLEQETDWDRKWNTSNCFFKYRFRKLDESKHGRNAYINFSGIRRDDNTPMTFASLDNNNIVVFENPIPITAGEVIGYPGKYESENMIHFEIFMDDVSFMDNKGRLTTEDPSDNSKNLHNWTGDGYFEKFIDINNDGYCEVETLKEKIKSAKNYNKSWLPETDDLKELVSHSDVSAFLRTTVCRHSTEWSTKVDEDTKRWERLKRHPWNIREDNLNNEVLPHFKRLHWWDQVQSVLDKGISRVQMRNKANYQKARAIGATRLTETDWIEQHGEEPLTLAIDPCKIYYFHPIKFVEHLKLIYPNRLKSEFLKELIKDWFASMSEEDCLMKLHCIFGADIKQHAFKKLRNNILRDSFEYPPIKIIERNSPKAKKLYGYSAGYNHSSKETWMDERFVKEAKQNNITACGLLIAMVEETGHHIDHILRNKYTRQGGDAPFDEGAVFGANVLEHHNFKDKESIHIATDLTDNTDILSDFSELQYAMSAWLSGYHQQTDNFLSEVSFSVIGTMAVGAVCTASVDVAVQLLDIYVNHDSDIKNHYSIHQTIIAALAGAANGGIGAIVQISSKATKIRRLLKIATREFLPSFLESVAKQMAATSENVTWLRVTTDVAIDLLSRILGMSHFDQRYGQTVLSNLVKGNISGSIILGSHSTLNTEKEYENIKAYRNQRLKEWKFISGEFYVKEDNGESHWMYVSKKPSLGYYRRYVSNKKLWYDGYRKSFMSGVYEKLKNGITEFKEEESWYIMRDGSKYYVEKTFTKIGYKSFKK